MEALAAVLLGIISNACTSLIRMAFENDDRLSLEKIIKLIIDKGITSFAWDGTPSVNEVCCFLDTPEVEEIVKQLVVLSVDPEERLSGNEIREEFCLLFIKYFELTASEAKQAEPLFRFLSTTTVSVITRAANEGSYIAFDLTQNFRHNQLMDYLSVIEKNLKFLSANSTSATEILDFESKLRSQMEYRFGFITPSDFDRTRRIEIDKLYVVPNFEFISGEQLKEPESIDKSGSSDTPDSLTAIKLLRQLRRCVIIGDPGAGKTTFTRKLCHAVCRRYNDRLITNRLLTPIHVTLRDFLKWKEDQHGSIVDFMHYSANSSFQINPPPGAFDYLLLNGRALVVFDGLDELLKKHQRVSMVEEVESFTRLYPTIPIVVTCRRVGYESTPLDPNLFDLFD